ncbi:hypothetical protein Hanom_Chr02g00126491 [Helianthus anomalus]
MNLAKHTLFQLKSRWVKSENANNPILTTNQVTAVHYSFIILRRDELNLGHVWLNFLKQLMTFWKSQ